MKDKANTDFKIPLKEHFGNFMVPMKDALDVFSGKWKIPIIAALNFYETCGFKDLEKIVEGITPKMLSKELKFLEDNLILTREVLPTRPVTVKYSITEYGRTCSSVMTALYAWGAKHRKEVFNIDTEDEPMESCVV